MNSTRTIRIIGAAFAALALTASPALAADRDVKVSSAAPEATWDGAMSTLGLNADDTDGGTVPCTAVSPIFTCDTTLVKIDSEGKLDITTKSASDVDIYTYKSDAEGSKGEYVASTNGMGGDESAVIRKVTAGTYYLVEVRYFTVVADGYAGKVKLTPTAVAGADSDIVGLAASQSAKKLKAFKGTASGASKVEIGLVKTNGGCSELTAGGKFKKIAKTGGKCVAKTFLAAAGTATWSFKLKKALAKGSYTLTSRATGASGAETTFDKADKNLASFKVK